MFPGQNVRGPLKTFYAAVVLLAISQNIYKQFFSSIRCYVGCPADAMMNAGNSDTKPQCNLPFVHSNKEIACKNTIRTKRTTRCILVVFRYATFNS